MKFRLGFISNSSSCSFIVAFPKGIKEEVICRAELRIENPPTKKLAIATGFPYNDYWYKRLEEFIKDLKVISQTDTETVYEIDIPFYIFRTYDDFIERMGYWYRDDEYVEERFSHYKNYFKRNDLGALDVDNESEDTLDVLIYFLGFKRNIILHPRLRFLEEDGW